MNIIWFLYNPGNARWKISFKWKLILRYILFFQIHADMIIIVKLFNFIESSLVEKRNFILTTIMY